MIDEVRSAWDAKASDWSRRSLIPRGYWNRRLRVITDLAVRYARACRSLDVGCGPGVLCRMLAEAGFDVHGTDVSGNMIRAAAALLEDLDPNAAVRFHHDSAAGIPSFPGGKRFGLVTAIGVLEYVEDRGRFIRGLTNFVKPGGYLILSNSENKSFFVFLCIASHVLRFRPSRAWFRMIGNLARTGIWTGGYVNYRRADAAYSADALDRLAADAGLEIVDGIDFFGLPGLDGNPLKRGHLGRRLARRWGWNHMGVYRHPSGNPKGE